MFGEIKVSVGELVDKYTILLVKKTHMPDNQHVLKEYQYLKHKVDGIGIDVKYIVKLLEVNNTIWMLEDTIRELHAKSEFGSSFVSTAQAIYKFNDRRFKIKTEINNKYSSDFVEQKLLPKY